MTWRMDWGKHTSEGRQTFRRYVSKATWAITVAWETAPWLLVGVVVGSVLLSLVPAGAAWVGRNLINSVVSLVRSNSGELSSVTKWLVAAMSLAVLQEVVSTFTSYVQSLQSDKLSLKLTLDILQHSADLDYAKFEDPKFQDVADRARYNASDIFTSILGRVISLATTLIETVSLSFVLVAVDPAIVIVMVVLAIPYGFYRWRHSREIFGKEYSRTTKRRWTRYFVSMMTGRSTLMEVKLLDLSPLLIGQFKDLNEEFISEDRRLYTRDYIVTLIFTLIFVVAFYVLFYRVANQAVGNHLTVGDVTLFAAVTMRLQGNLNRFAQQVSSTAEQILYLDNLIEYFRIKPQHHRDEGIVITDARGDIEFKDVTFTYPGTKNAVLHNIDLHISPGETVAIVGENGAGKSTLVSLIARLFDPDSGQVLLDGMDLQDLALSSLHNEISFVLQTFNQYEASAADNIRFGNYRQIKTLDEIKRIAKLTNVDQLIAQMPNGYETQLGRRFGEYDLSGGMWQKVAIARAMTRSRAAVLILDEPTAALDVKAEWELFKQFKELAMNRTAIIISHRFTTVSVADRILMLEKGRIVESGTHHQLIELGGKYATLFSYYKQRLEFSPTDSV
jgi:ATP-binding cassette subfamily B protein